jgi:hypothetical protein
MLNSQLTPATSNRVFRSFALRTQEAGEDAFSPSVPQLDNGDEALYSDKSGTYTKGVLQSVLGLVDLAAYNSFKAALASGKPADFESIVVGNAGNPKGRLNGPQGGLAFYLANLDADQITSPPAPAAASEAYATELVELYWASLLRDKAFSDYAGEPTAKDAAKELNDMPAYAGPKDDVTKMVTPDLLFRGSFPGEKVGPYISQFLLVDYNVNKNVALGTLPIVQKYLTNTSKDFLTDPVEFLNVQNGKKPSFQLTSGPAVYLHDGRGLAAYTHGDVLYQAYFIAYLVLSALNAPPNPGIPYNASKTQKPFATLGDPDIAATLASVAGLALKSVWYQKWWVHLRHRPESGGGLVHLQKTGQGGTVQANVSNTVLNSKAVQASYDANNKSYLLSQAFPEGAPTHPAYPTGHGAVAGACITVLKFFYDGSWPIPGPRAPKNDGSDTIPAPGNPVLTVNGELHKLASNISFGHGILSGIHWRSDTDASIRLGEAVAISCLRDLARTYNESFSISFKALDDTTVTISNL